MAEIPHANNYHTPLNRRFRSTPRKQHQRAPNRSEPLERREDNTASLFIKRVLIVLAGLVAIWFFS